MDYVKTAIPILEQESGEEGPLDGNISIHDVRLVIKRMKNKKAVGTDQISNEMIKTNADLFENSILHLCNIILKSGKWPTLWKNSYIVPIHKSGDQTDPNNYRGIAVSSCLSKILTKIMESRLQNYMESNNLWNRNQCGFMSGHRTEDNIFVLKSIFNKYINAKKGRIYVAFVDFKKFFDSINREHLLYKLIKHGIIGKFYHLVKSMYSNTFYNVKTLKGFTKSFKSNTGLKQGCNLSPVLANLFQNDLHAIFDKKNYNPVNLSNITFNSLSFADDLVLLSTSQEGLQLCLDKLQAYCYKWGLSVNESKSKFMVFSKGIIKNASIKFGNKYLELVTNYKYLGIILCANGTIKKAVDDRILKANGALYLLKQILSSDKGNISPKLSINLFDKQIVPILLYASPLWSLPHNGADVYFNLKYDVTENVRKLVQEKIKQVSGKDLGIVSVRKIGNASPKKLLVKFDNYKDKKFFIMKFNNVKASLNWYIETPTIEDESHVIESFHCKFLKYVLGINKYASNIACRSELGRYPLLNTARSHAIKYWGRLENGTNNVFVNNAFATAKSDNDRWLQAVEYYMDINGLSEMFNNANKYTPNELKYIIHQRVNDQYIQYARNKLESSPKFKILNIVRHEDYVMYNYLNMVRSSNIRKTITRLRIDMNTLNDCQYRQNKNTVNKCRFCNNDSVEDVEHFLIDCCKFNNLRQSFFIKLSDFIPMFNSFSNDMKIKIILDLDFKLPQESIKKCCGIVCNFLKTLYKARLSL